jgi:hypothetical protein
MDPFYFLSACPRSACAAVCSVLAEYVLVVEASVAHAIEPTASREFAAVLVR